jgi:hypothetical protein
MVARRHEGTRRRNTLLLFVPTLAVLVAGIVPIASSTAYGALTREAFPAPPEPCFLLDEATTARMAPGLARRGGDDSTGGVHVCRWGHLVSPGALQIIVVWFESYPDLSADDQAQEYLRTRAEGTATAPPIGDEARLWLSPEERGPDVLAFRKANVVVEISYPPQGPSDDLLLEAARQIDRRLTP